MQPYKPLQIEDYFQEEERASPEVLAEAILPEEELPKEFDEHEEGYKFGVDIAGDSEDLEAIRQAISEELAALHTNNREAQKRAINNV